MNKENIKQETTTNAEEEDSTSRKRKLQKSNDNDYADEVSFLFLDKFNDV